MPDLTELQRLAEGATPGEWVLELPPANWYSRAAYVRAPSWGIVATMSLDPSLPHWDGPQRANAAYIAAMHPDTAKKLIAVALAAQASVRAWNALDATPVGSFTGKEVPACEAADEALRKALRELR